MGGQSVREVHQGGNGRVPGAEKEFQNLERDRRWSMPQLDRRRDRDGRRSLPCLRQIHRSLETKELALQNSQLTRLLLANSAHEVRTPLNAIINYLEIAMEGSLDKETRDNLSKSHSASKSLIYVINDLLDLTKTEEGGELTKDEIFDIRDVLREATEMFSGDARRKNISYDVTGHADLPLQVVGDARRVRQAISNVTANAIQNTSQGGVSVTMCVASREGDKVEIEICVSDTGVGMDGKKLDALFRELEQVQSDNEVDVTMDGLTGSHASLAESNKTEEGRTLGLGLAVVSRILRNMNGQLRLKSEEGKGSRFVLLFPLDLPEPGLGGQEPSRMIQQDLRDRQHRSPRGLHRHLQRLRTPPRRLY